MYTKMNKKIEIPISETCTNCVGILGMFGEPFEGDDGFIPSPIHAEYWRLWVKHRDNFIKKWMVETKETSVDSMMKLTMPDGTRFDESFDEWIERNHPRPDCSSEDICPECEGNQIVLRWVSINEFRDLLDTPLSTIPTKSYSIFNPSGIGLNQYPDTLHEEIEK